VAIAIRHDARPSPRRRHHLARRVRYELTGQPVEPPPAPAPAVPIIVIERPQWRGERVVELLAEIAVLARTLRGTQAELAQQRKLNTAALAQLAAVREQLAGARYGLKLLAQEALEREWVLDGGPA
jgi:hypothetical protein